MKYFMNYNLKKPSMENTFLIQIKHIIEHCASAFVSVRLCIINVFTAKFYLFATCSQANNIADENKRSALEQVNFFKMNYEQHI